MYKSTISIECKRVTSKSREILNNEMAVVNQFEIHRYQTGYSRPNKINNMIMKESEQNSHSRGNG